MGLPPGTRLAFYEIVAPLGAGGMGEVYRARDSRLKRDVAIKVLPDAFAEDPDRLARFQREAELLASLNHPNIAAIYGLEHIDRTVAIVLELVEGETLADVIARGGGSIPDGLAIARQIIDALEAAHERGIIHRDLKPANIKITPDGRVKVLDFGLAKILETTPAASSMTMSPTLSVRATYAGMILGTAAYMSPEQARGKPVDRRTDVWAFGCVLYEILTGNRAFDAGETVSDAIVSVLSREPVFDALPPDTPTAIRRLLRRCLHKDVQKRLPHIGAARIEIDEALSGADEPLTASHPAATQSLARPAKWYRVLPWTVAAALLIAVVAMWSRDAGGGMPEVGEVRLAINAPDTTDAMSFALSPDGRQLVVVGTSQGSSRLWLRPLDSINARPLERTDGAGSPFWSPDSQSIGFFADRRLKRLDVATGSVQVLADSRGAVGGSWGADGTIVFSEGTSSGLSAVSANGGAVRRVTQLRAGEQGHILPAFLPDGRHFTFYARGDDHVRGLYISSIDGGTPDQLLGADASAPVFVVSDTLLFVRQGALFAQPFDVTRRQMKGDALSVADQVAVDARNHAALTVATNGTIAYRASAGSNRRQLVWVDRSGAELDKASSPDDNRAFSPALSPDGSTVALHRAVNNVVDIWLYDLRRQAMRRFTTDAPSDLNPRWSPDGRRIVFSSFRTGHFEMFIKPAAGGTEEPLHAVGTPQDWSPDGKYILYQRRSGPGESQRLGLWALSLSDGQSLPVAETAESDAVFSPSGKWVAFTSQESGRFDVYVQGFPSRATKTLVSTAGGAQPRWSSDGHELFYVALDDRLMSVPVTETSRGTIELGRPTALFATNIGGAVQELTTAQYMVAPRRFLMNTLLPADTASPITVVLHPRFSRK